MRDFVHVASRKLPFLAALVLLGAVGAGRMAEAFNPQPDPPGHFGMIGVAEGQTARLNVVGIGNPDTRCSMTLMFLDGEGNALAEKTVVLTGGTSDFLDLNFDELGGPDTREGRLQLLPTMQALGGPDTKGCDGVIPTTEIFDNETGQTMVILNPAVLRGFNPQPDPPGSSAFGPAGR